MLKRFWPLLILIILVVGAGLLWQQYRSYKAEQQRRIEALQQKAEEVQVTIIEGWTQEDIAKKLEEAGLFSAKDFEEAVEKFDTSNFEPLIDRPDNASLEGYLFPDTYRFAKESTPEQVIQKMLENFNRRLASIGLTEKDQPFTIPSYEGVLPEGRDGEAGMSLYEVLTLASIVELESGDSSNMSLAEERAMIAGVFYNRLVIGQGLESDATVNYVTGKNDPGVSLKDTDVNSPYNTYRYAGLPPGPIGNPSLGSIQAVLRPTKSDFFYFLHKQPSGEVQFSKTFAEHVQKK